MTMMMPTTTIVTERSESGIVRAQYIISSSSSSSSSATSSSYSGSNTGGGGDNANANANADDNGGVGRTDIVVRLKTYFLCLSNRFTKFFLFFPCSPPLPPATHTHTPACPLIVGPRVEVVWLGKTKGEGGRGFITKKKHNFPI